MKHSPVEDMNLKDSNDSFKYIRQSMYCLDMILPLSSVTYKFNYSRVNPTYLADLTAFPIYVLDNLEGSSSASRTVVHSRAVETAHLIMPCYPTAAANLYVFGKQYLTANETKVAVTRCLKGRKVNCSHTRASLPMAAFVMENWTGKKTFPASCSKCERLACVRDCN